LEFWNRLIEHLGVNALAALETECVTFTEARMWNSESRCIEELDGGFELADVAGPHFRRAVNGPYAADDVIAVTHPAFARN
jgi:hypothetical protein